MCEETVAYKWIVIFFFLRSFIYSKVSYQLYFIFRFLVLWAWVLFTEGWIGENTHKILNTTVKKKNLIIVVMFDHLLNYHYGEKKLTVHYWKQVFHIIINNIRLILNEYVAEMALQKKYYYIILMLQLS